MSQTLCFTNICSFNFHKTGQRPSEVNSLAQGHTVRSGAAGADSGCLAPECLI